MKIIKVEFTKEEQDAIKLIATINCGGVPCCGCPFNQSDSDNCVKGILRHIALEGGFYE